MHQTMSGCQVETIYRGALTGISGVPEFPSVVAVIS
jgi:hypothetical protein